MWPQSRDLKHLCNSAATLFCTMSKSLCLVHASKILWRWLDDDMHEMIDLGNFEIIQWLHFASPSMWILYLFLRNKTQTVFNFSKSYFQKWNFHFSSPESPLLHQTMFKTAWNMLSDTMVQSWNVLWELPPVLNDQMLTSNQDNAGFNSSR